MQEPGAINIEIFPLGDFQTNCFVVSRPSGVAWLVDVGQHPAEMLDHVEEAGLKVEKIILTHAHADHIAGVAEALQRFPDTPLLIHESERDFPGDASLNLSLYISQPVVAPDPTGVLTHGQTLELDGVSFEVRHTPGHSPGGITLYQPDTATAIVGDTLFAQSIGRFDFPTSDGPLLIKSIHEQLLTLPDDTRVLPGHGPETTIGRERASNPYLRETDLV
ncbi:MBL fold metallo-hydrolase [Algisphaera agarilytica]|uniref:Glyoxylase-like metal-dependent hydrolase (Beta-lactamase superfamily II) n=1 Tax=Algisphaera agarilytica TaxID=1385975 RepID=A0A7X0H907_9BACT|nr:MBL fold metallo-hydrolase [Algisphaera agarilytica]MBB6431441.1 glyoxylase-like metal-dependent hydrolase (beta-lactamase superfamily II) [Algisphaera agarilytica]